MNSDPLKSAQPCGCDEGARHVCEQHRMVYKTAEPDNILDLMDKLNEADLEECLAARRVFPDSAQGRKDHPVFTGVLMYFPDAIAAVAHVSKLGNDQHNPGQPLHWARGKSTDQTNTATRHMMDHGVGNIKDTDGAYHMAKAAWRCLAELQLTIERERENA